MTNKYNGDWLDISLGHIVEVGVARLLFVRGNLDSFYSSRGGALHYRPGGKSLVTHYASQTSLSATKIYLSILQDI